MKLLFAILEERKWTLLLVWLSTITFFLWINKVNLLAHILGQPGLTILEKVDFVIGVYADFFIYLGNPVPFTSLIFSILTAVNITLLIHLARTVTKTGALRGNTGTVMAVVGSHCLSCGGSIAAPIITTLAGTGTYISSERVVAGQLLASAVNILGMILVIWSIRGVVRRIVSVGQPPKATALPT